MPVVEWSKIKRNSAKNSGQIAHQYRNFQAIFLTIPPARNAMVVAQTRAFSQKLQFLDSGSALRPIFSISKLGDFLSNLVYFLKWHKIKDFFYQKLYSNLWYKIKWINIIFIKFAWLEYLKHIKQSKSTLIPIVCNITWQWTKFNLFTHRHNT